MHPLGLALFFLALGWITRKVLRMGSRDPLLPPGPSTIPILGNLTILPKKDSYLRFTEWARQYGGVYSLKVGSETSIVITSFDAVHEILEINGGKTSDRPQKVYIHRIFGPDGSVGASRYGPSWRMGRRAFSEALKPSSNKKYIPGQMAEVRQLVYDIYRKPDCFFDEIQRAVFSTSFSIALGVRTPRLSSPFITRFNSYIEELIKIGEPGNIPPLELLPWLKYIPERYTNYWKSRCDAIRNVQRGMFLDLVELVEKRKQEGMENGCALENMMKVDDLKLDREKLAYIAGNLLTGSAYQITSLTRLLVLLATAYPETQMKIHDELSRIIGFHRSPIMEDLPNLPYLRAFLKEAHRFRPTNPIAQPHLATEDQMYRGYLIPKGATIFLNIWGISHDPDSYDSPEIFNPDRFIKSHYGIKEEARELLSAEGLKKLESLPFGAGRRKCPGEDLANNTALLIAANLLWSFEFSPAIDEMGNEIIPDIWAFSAGFTNDVLPFKCTIKTRSPSHSKIIVQNYINSTQTLEMFEQELTQGDRSYVEEHRRQAIKLAQKL